MINSKQDGVFQRNYVRQCIEYTKLVKTTYLCAYENVIKLEGCLRICKFKISTAR